jgi:hypothetical protein
MIWSLILAIVVGSLVLFFLFVRPSLNGGNSYRIGADSSFYLWYAGLIRDNPYGSNSDPTRSLIELGSNLLGPFLIASLLRSNIAILCFNYVVFFYTIYMVSRTRSINCAVLSSLLLVNPIIFVSLVTLNKEILAVAASVLLYCYLDGERKSRLLLLIVLTVSLLARWEHLLLVLVFLLMTAKWNPLNRHRGIALGAIVVLITICYPLIATYIGLNFGADPLTANTIVRLTDLQSHFLYPIVVIPKLLMNLYGGIVGLVSKARDSNDIYNALVVPWGCLVNAIATVWFLLSRRCRLSDDMFFFAALYGAILSASPFVQTRYFIPIYVVLSVDIATRVNQSALHTWVRLGRHWQIRHIQTEPA